ncbi:O-antigen ligase family protein [Thalassotalea ponticola]|uniref:O-antigen ligase family protein n=1 Tax=Thalassotalea ponticola TaxID=1523392 RepID=UPI0025B4796A|nr:O-antigen ligase family protein [Thalassotalea ponticola]MDN3652418.1 O-antigen ligase family protein [Thalassotalea ponticola]
MTFVILCLYFIVVIIRPHEWFEATRQWEAARYLILLCAIAYALFEEKKFWPKQLSMLLGVALAILLSMVFTGWLSGGINRSVMFVFSSVIPVLLISNIVKQPWQVEWIMRIMVFGTLVMVAHGYVQVTSPDGVGWTGQALIMERATYIGIYGDPNDFGMYVLITIPMMFYLLSESKGFIGKNYYRLAILASLYGIYISNSRGTLVGALALLGFYFYQKFGVLKTAIMSIFTLPIVLLVMGKFRAIDLEENSAQDRVLAWYDGIHMFFANTIFGVGKGWFTDFHSLTAHNSYILVLAELGMFGFVFWFAAMSYSMMQMSGLFDGKANKIQITLFYSLLAFATTGFFLSRSFSNIFYLLIGLSAAIWWQKMQKSKAKNFELAQVQVQQAVASVVLAPFAVVAIYMIIKILLMV